MMTVSVCVIAYNEEKYLPELLGQLSLQTYPHNLIEIVLVNSKSEDNTIEIMKKNGEDIQTEVLGIKDEKGNEMDSCPHPQQKIFVTLDVAPEVGNIIKM